MVRTCIQVTALLLTLGAAFFLGKGSMALSPEAIAELASAKRNDNPGMIRHLAGQKGDTWAGVALLILGLLFQLMNTLWPMRIKDFDVSLSGSAMSLVPSVVALLGAFYASRVIAQMTENGVRKILRRETVEREATATD